MSGPVDPRLLRHARGSRSGVALLALLGLGQALITIAIIVALTRIVVALVEIAQSRAHSGLPVGTLGLLAGAFIGRALIAAAEQLVAERTAARVALELRAAVLSAALERGPAWVAGFGTGRLAALLGGGLDALRPWFAGYLPALVLAVALPPLVLVAMALVDPSSALIAGLTLPLVPVFGALIGIATAARARERVQAAARLSGHFLDVVRGLAALKLYGRAERQVTVVQEMTERHRSATVRVLRIAFLSSTALDLVATLSVGLIAVAAGLRVAAGELDLGPALLVILLAPEAYRPLREVGARFHAGADASAVIAEVDAVLTTSPALAPALTTALTTTIGRPSLDVCDLRVRHPGARTQSLALAALSLHGGEFVALAGPSGAGKTTALRVFAGVQEPTAGRVERTGGRPLYLPQRPTLPHARSVRDALLLPDEARTVGDAAVEASGQPSPTRSRADAVLQAQDQHGRTHSTDDALVEALAAVGLADEIAAMPDGLDTALGEHGRGLSSGQRQRLALARLLRAIRRPTSDPVLLLLDEPTAHLDPVAEAAVIEQLRAATRLGYAVLVVAHRPALLAAVDRTVTLAPPPSPSTAPPLAPAPPASLPAARDREGFVGDAPTEPSRSWRFARTGSGLGMGGAIGLGALAWLAGVTLTGAASWLLVRAATLPPVLTLSTAVVIVRASAVIRPLARYLERLTAHEVAFTRLGQRRAEVFADLIPRVPGAGLHRRGELLSRIVADVDARVDGVLRGQLPAAAAGLTLTAAGLAALVLLPTVALAVSVGLLVAAVVAPALAARQATALDVGSALARARLADAVVETVDGMDELAGQEDVSALRVPIERGQALARIEARAARSAGAATALAHLGLGSAVIGSALALASAVGSGRLGTEAAAVLLLGLVALSEPVLSLPDAAIARRRAAGAQDRLQAVKALPRSGAEPARPELARPEPVEPFTEPGTISVRGLVAGWDPARPPALTGLDLELPPRSRTAILGASGSGKSTLAGVLAGLLDPAAGSLRRGGARVALVGDDVDHVFASTVRENLRLSRPDASDDTLHSVLSRVRLGDWLAGLPHGLDSWLGEGGSTISGGEQRRLVTARALLVDPDLLVLDEPTEGLDEPTARALMADLLDATAGRRVLLLTHRSEGLDRVDVVHELIGGRLRVDQRTAHRVMA